MGLEGTVRTGDLLLVYGLSGYAEEAKSVEDGYFEAAHFGERWIHVQGTICY
jgi:hypothetical protein